MLYQARPCMQEYVSMHVHIRLKLLLEVSAAVSRTLGRERRRMEERDAAATAPSFTYK